MELHRTTIARITTNNIFTVCLFLIALASVFFANVSSVSADTSPFIKNYRLYDRSDDVRSLQIFLNKNGFVIVPQGSGSPGNETTYFGVYTFRALKRFQATANLPATGFFGPLTREKIISSLSTSSPALDVGATASSTADISASATNTNPEPPNPWQSYYPQTQSQNAVGGGGGGGGGGTGGAVSLPPSCNISASPQLIAVGSSTLLAWSSSNAFAASVPAIHSTALSGSQIVSLGTTTTFTVTVSNEGTVVTCSTTVLALPPDTTPPSASILSPSTGSTVSGSSVTMSATASDNIAVSDVTFKVDGVGIGSPIATPPYTINWDSTTVFNKLHTMSVVARDAWSNYATTSINLIVSNTSSPLATTTVFAPTSFWYTPIPANATLNASSSAMDTNLLAQIAAYFVDVNINICGYNQPIYVATSGTPTLNVTKTGTPDARAIVRSVR